MTEQDVGHQLGNCFSPSRLFLSVPGLFWFVPFSNLPSKIVLIAALRKPPATIALRSPQNMVTPYPFDFLVLPIYATEVVKFKDWHWPQTPFPIARCVLFDFEHRRFRNSDPDGFV